MLLPPPSRDWCMLAALRASDLLAVRRVLRDLARDADALLALLVLEGTIVEFAGDNAVMPVKFPKLTRTVPCFEDVPCRDREEHHAGFLKIRSTVRSNPSYGLLVVEPNIIDVPNLSDRLEAAAITLEPILLLP